MSFLFNILGKIAEVVIRNAPTIIRVAQVLPMLSRLVEYWGMAMNVRYAYLIGKDFDNGISELESGKREDWYVRNYLYPIGSLFSCPKVIETLIETVRIPIDLYRILFC